MGLSDLCLSSLPPKWYPHISKTFHLPTLCKIREREKMKTISQSPYHNHLFVYVNAFKARLRFPLNPFIVKFLNLSNLNIIQLSSNSWVILSFFVILCRLLEIEPSVSIFRSFYTICPNRDKGFWTLYSRIDCGLFGNAPTSWKA